MKPAEPLLWGLIGAVAGVVLALVAAWAGPSMPLVGATLLAAGFAAAFGRMLFGAAGPVPGGT